MLGWTAGILPRKSTSATCAFCFHGAEEAGSSKSVTRFSESVKPTTAAAKAAGLKSLNSGLRRCPSRGIVATVRAIASAKQRQAILAIVSHTSEICAQKMKSIYKTLNFPTAAFRRPSRSEKTTTIGFAAGEFVRTRGHYFLSWLSGPRQDPYNQRFRGAYFAARITAVVDHNKERTPFRSSYSRPVGGPHAA
jgi:hypothetical protein